MSRKKSREVVMKLLFETTIKKEDFIKVIQDLKESIDIDLEQKQLMNINEDKQDRDEEEINLKNVDMEYVVKILKGIKENQEIIDKKIEENLKNWTLKRLSKIDLSILRICTYEILFDEEIPNRVSINEAIELAKKYSGNKSSAFINGVLNNLIN